MALEIQAENPGKYTDDEDGDDAFALLTIAH